MLLAPVALPPVVELIVMFRILGLLRLAGVHPAAALVLSVTGEVMNLLTALPGAVLYVRGPFQRRVEAE